MAEWKSEWNELFPALTGNNPSEEWLKEHLQVVELPAGLQVFQPGSACENFLMVIDGSVKVTLTGAGGKEMVLYRVESGGTCLITTSCLFSNELYPADGLTESPVTALVLSPSDFHQALSICEAFRTFVFSSLGFRFSDLMARIESVSFQSIDCRLATALLELMGQDQSIHTTHQNLATELGSAREVVSRHLKRFENQDLLKQSRNNIQITDVAALKAISEKN